MTASMESLTNEQLCALAQAGDEQAKSRLIENNKSFIRQTAEQFAGNPSRTELFSVCGIGVDDLTQAGSIGLWRAIDGYDPSRESSFLTYASPAIRRAMVDLVRQYSQDTVWRLKQNQSHPWQIIYLDAPLDNAAEDTVECFIASPDAKSPEQICIEQEAMSELHEAMSVLSDREDVYVRYRFGFADSEAHALTESAQHFRLTVSRAKSLERSALKQLRHELLFEIPERAFARAEDRLTKMLVSEGELHSVELRLKSQKKRGKKIITAVYEYLADYGGKWGELSYNFKDGIAEILQLAEWDTKVSRRFAIRAVEYLREHSEDVLPDRIMLTFIGPEQRRNYHGDQTGTSN